MKVGREKQSVERHVTGEGRKQMKDKTQLNTEGKLKGETTWRAEWLASEMQDERQKVKHSIQYAVHFHEGGGEVNDMEKLEVRTQEQNNFRIRRAARCEHAAAKSQNKVRNNKQEQMKGKFRGCAWFYRGLAITIKKTCKNYTGKKGHDLWRMIQGERPRVLCARCAGCAEHLLAKLLTKISDGQPQQEKDRNKRYAVLQNWKKDMKPPSILKHEGSKVTKTLSVRERERDQS